MRRAFLTFLLPALLAITLHAEVIRPAPNFVWESAGGKAQSLKNFRGQPVVLLIADSARSRQLRAQIARLEELYRFYSARRVVFAVALRSEDRAVKSEIPFVPVRNGSAVASEYGVDRGYSIVIIGPDGNVDYITDEVLPGERVRTVINNTFVRQQEIRKKD